MMLIENKTTKETIAAEVRVCKTMIERLVGLLGTKSLKEKEACWIQKCNSIHTFGMRYAIDAYFLDQSNVVVGVMQNMKPGRISPIYFKAKSVVEMSSDKSRRCRVGDLLIMETKS